MSHCLNIDHAQHIKISSRFYTAQERKIEKIKGKGREGRGREEERTGHSNEDY